MEKENALLAKRSPIEDLVLMRTKLLKWTSFGPHFTQKASFSTSMKHKKQTKTLPKSILLFMG